MKNEMYGAEEIYLAPETIASEEVPEENSVPSDEMQSRDIAVTLEAEPKKPTRVGEILDLREGNRKVFRMSDGTEQAVYYSETVHVLDEATNAYIDVDNTVIEEEDGRHFVNAKSRFKARFSREEENDELFSIESGMHRVTVSAKKTGKQRNKGVKPEVRKKTAAGVERTDTLVYTDVQAGADYAYSVTGDGVKEDIVVRERADVYRYPFVIDQENVTAVHDQANKRIAFVSNETGEEVFFIPAPFMTDKNGAVSTAVSYEVKNTASGSMILNIVADSQWMNAEGRAFPVVIDPQIQRSGSSAMTTYSWDNGYLYNASLHTVGAAVVTEGPCNAKRMYVKFRMPVLPRNPRIKKAELKFFQESSSGDCIGCPKIGIYRVPQEPCLGECTPYHSSNLIDFAQMQVEDEENPEIVSYTFDITTLLDQVNKGELESKYLVLKMVEEKPEFENSVVLYGASQTGAYAPRLTVTYESSYGVNTSYRTHTHELGRFGQGSIDLQCGNLMFESEDFAWAGTRMPVTIKHLYNSALGAYQYTANSTIELPAANFNLMKVGNGFKLNIMQSLIHLDELPIVWTEEELQNESMEYDGYVYIGENGEATYFKRRPEPTDFDGMGLRDNLYEDVNGSGMLYDPMQALLRQGDDFYRFDTQGRLIAILDTANNQMSITYSSDKIVSVTDGTGRDFWFAYSGSHLTSITAPDGSVIQYGYSGDLLTSVTYPDGRRVAITYYQNKPLIVSLYDAGGNCVYKVTYAFEGDRLTSVTEYGVNDVLGAKSTYSYSVASGRTVVETTEPMDTDAGETADSVIKTVYTFDDEGNIVSQYAYSQDMENTGVEGEESGIHPYSDGVDVVSNINNLLTGHNFDDLSAWLPMSGNGADFEMEIVSDESKAKFGKNFLRMESHESSARNDGVYQMFQSLPAGQYTFSVYVRPCSTFTGTGTGAFIRVADMFNETLAISERLTRYETGYTRLIVPFTLESAKTVRVQILLNGDGELYADGAQLEKNPSANAYNMLENGNFEGDTGWFLNSTAAYTTAQRFNMTRSMSITGDLTSKARVSQKVYVMSGRDTRETFTLSGWAKGHGLPNRKAEGTETPTFRLRAFLVYRDGDQEIHSADFSPCTEEWQLASVTFAKQKHKGVAHIWVACEYDFNFGTAYFDNIQLVRNSLETSLSASDFMMESESEAIGTGEETSAQTETEDTAPAFSEAKDAFGNTLTETTFADGEFGTIYRAFNFTPCCNSFGNTGNELVGEIDARGKETTYVVDEDTSRNEIVTDRCGNKTAYEYDAAGKVTKVTSKNTADKDLAHVSYTYDAFDNMTKIARGDDMKYVLAYNPFHNLESIGIIGKAQKLIRYTYKNGSGRLKQMTYANGHTMKATYNSIGQLVAEKWYKTEAQAAASATPIAHYKYLYDSAGNIVQSIDITAGKCYNYEYEEGRLIRATESDVGLTNECVVTKTVVNTIRYYYDSEGQMTRKVIFPADGPAQTTYYETNDDNTTVKFPVGDGFLTSHSKTDAFGRKEFDEIQLGKGSVSRQFAYHEGKVPDVHKDNNLVKSSPTTQLVSQIILSNGTTLDYAYDNEERIISVVESYDVECDTVTNTTTYTYDALGQLETETVNGRTVKFAYDGYGNITAKGAVDETGEIAEATKVTYTYDSTWKDLLTGYNGQEITCDFQGTPVSYLGHALTWEKGRQLKSFDGITYTYNANGIRTSKTVNGVKHTYTLDGTKILRETWTENETDYSIVPMYDNEESKSEAKRS